MPLSKEELEKRARSRSSAPGDYWDNVARMLARKTTIARGDCSQREWNWIHGIREQLTAGWE